MNNDIYSIDFTRSLPPPLKGDPNMYALAKVIAEQLQITTQQIKKNVIYPRIDELDDQTLDILAYDLHVDWYDYSYPIQVKRATIKNSIKVQRKLGTKYAVETAISAIYPNTEVREWWQYAGEPYHFKIAIEIGDELIEIERSRQVLQRIEYYKNLRSVLDEVSYIVKPLPIPNPPPVLWLRHLLLHLHFSSYGDSEYLFLNGRKLLDGTWLLNQMLRGVNFRQVGFCMQLLEAEGLEGTDFTLGALELSNHFSGLALALAAFWIRLPNSFDLSFVRLNGQRLLDGSWLLDQEVHGIHFPSFTLRATLSEVERLAEQMHLAFDPLALGNDTEDFQLEQVAVRFRFANYLGLSFVWLNGQRFLDGSWLLDQEVHGIYFSNLSMHATLSVGEQLAKQMQLTVSRLALQNNAADFQLERTTFAFHFAEGFARGAAFHALAFTTVLQNAEQLALQQKIRLTLKTSSRAKMDSLSLQGKLYEQTRMQAASFTLGAWRVQTASKLSKGTITQDSMWHLDGKRSCDGRYKLNADIKKETI